MTFQQAGWGLILPLRFRNQNVGGLRWVAHSWTYTLLPPNQSTQLGNEDIETLEQNMCAAFHPEVRHINASVLQGVHTTPGQVAHWQKEVQTLCARRHWLRLFIRNGGLDTLFVSKAEQAVNGPTNALNICNQASYDEEEIDDLTVTLPYLLPNHVLDREVLSILREERHVKGLFDFELEELERVCESAR